MTQLLSVEKEAGVATVTIDNPPMNVLSQQLILELNDVFTQFNQFHNRDLPPHYYHI